MSWRPAVGEVDYYVVRLQDRSQTVHRFTVSRSSAPECSFSSLVAGRLYSVVIETRSGSLENSTTVQARTREEGQYLHFMFRHDLFFNLFYFIYFYFYILYINIFLMFVSRTCHRGKPNSCSLWERRPPQGIIFSWTHHTFIQDKNTSKRKY